jgi:hypothetical protein
MLRLRPLFDILGASMPLFDLLGFSAPRRAAVHSQPDEAARFLAADGQPGHNPFGWKTRYLQMCSFDLNRLVHC